MSGHGVNARGEREETNPFQLRAQSKRERERKIAKRIARHFCSFPQKVIKRLARGVAVQSFRVYRRKKKGGVDAPILERRNFSNDLLLFLPRQ